MFALLIRLPEPLEKYTEHPDMVYEVKQKVATFHRILSQLLILLEWLAPHFPRSFYIGSIKSPDQETGSLSAPLPPEARCGKPYRTDDAEAQFYCHDDSTTQGSFGFNNLSGIPGSEELSDEEFNRLVDTMYPIESCANQSLGLTDYKAGIETETTAGNKDKDIQGTGKPHAKGISGGVCLGEEESKNLAIATKWEQLQHEHNFAGNLFTIFRRFVPDIGAQVTNRLLQLALALFLPETLLRVKKHIEFLRQKTEFRTEMYGPVPTWIYRTAVQCCQGRNPNQFSMRLFQWYVYQYIETQRGLWDPAIARHPSRDHIINQIATSEINGPRAPDYAPSGLDLVKRKIQSWHDQGREWHSMVQAAGSGSILLFIPDKPAQYSAAPAVSATKYRNLTPKHAHVVIGMVREARQLPCSLFKDEDLFNSFVFHRPPQITYRLELLTDDEIRQEPIDSDQLLTISKPLKAK